MSRVGVILVEGVGQKMPKLTSLNAMLHILMNGKFFFRFVYIFLQCYLFSVVHSDSEVLLDRLIDFSK